MSQSLTLVVLIASLCAYASTCNLKINAFRAYENNFGVFEITYEGSSGVVGLDFSLDKPTLDTRSVETVDKSSGVSRQGVSFQPHRLRVGDTVYYKLFIESGGKKQCETDLEHFQITEVKIVKPT
ncbi:hypothetical protein FQR65_LT03490 [Abscondita terminalis]|nr:hypothetical protein FQR65_LT03490 [Abscondita terminalis]